jgi:hypothetical protein
VQLTLSKKIENLFSSAGTGIQSIFQGDGHMDLIMMNSGNRLLFNDL